MKRSQNYRVSGLWRNLLLSRCTLTGESTPTSRRFSGVVDGVLRPQESRSGTETTKTYFSRTRTTTASSSISRMPMPVRLRPYPGMMSMRSGSRSMRTARLSTTDTT